jgi:hypothetical protein
LAAELLLVELLAVEKSFSLAAERR